MSDTTPQTIGFEDSLKELEQIVRCLEDGDTGLEEALGHYEKGVGLLKHCYGQLRQAEQRIQLLTGETPDGQPVTESFEPAATLELQRIVPGKRK
jgi:exodeoxyribonuclease VII small subunit